MCTLHLLAQLNELRMFSQLLHYVSFLHHSDEHIFLNNVLKRVPPQLVLHNLLPILLEYSSTYMHDLSLEVLVCISHKYQDAPFVDKAHIKGSDFQDFHPEQFPTILNNAFVTLRHPQHYAQHLYLQYEGQSPRHNASQLSNQTTLCAHFLCAEIP